MNARQFFDVWPHVVRQAGIARYSPCILHVCVANLGTFVASRHGPVVEADALRRFHGLLSDSKTCGPR